MRPPLELALENVPLAIVLVACASLMFAGGATLQQQGVSGIVDQTASNRSMSLRQMLRLLRSRVWLAGLGVSIAGGLTHIGGLTLAPVTVVQPVGVLSVPWAVLFGARISRTWPPARLWVAVGATFVGVAGFTAISTSSAVEGTWFSDLQVVAAAGVVVIFGLVLAAFGRFGAPRWRCLMWAAAGSFFYGLSSALIRVLTVLLAPGCWARPVFWAVAVIWLGGYAVGGWMVQQAYANGPAEIVVGAMTTIDPIIAVSFGLTVLGEGARIGWPEGLGLVAAGGVAVLGVLSLSQHHPAAIQNRSAKSD